MCCRHRRGSFRGPVPKRALIPDGLPVRARSAFSGCLSAGPRWGAPSRMRLLVKLGVRAPRFTGAGSGSDSSSSSSPSTSVSASSARSTSSAIFGIAKPISISSSSPPMSSKSSSSSSPSRVPHLHRRLAPSPLTRRPVWRAASDRYLGRWRGWRMRLEEGSHLLHSGQPAIQQFEEDGVHDLTGMPAVPG